MSHFWYVSCHFWGIVVGHVVHVIVVVEFESLTSSVEVRQFVECVRVASMLVLVVQFRKGFASSVLLFDAPSPHLC